MSLRIVIVEDDRSYLEMLESLLSWEEGYTIAGKFESPLHFLRAAKEQARMGRTKWDLVLMDLCLPELNGIETSRLLKEILPRLSVVIFTVFEEPEAIVRAIRPGEKNRLLKKTSAHELLCQLRTLAAASASPPSPRPRPRYLFSGLRPAALSLCARVMKKSRSQTTPD